MRQKDLVKLLGNRLKVEDVGELTPRERLVLRMRFGVGENEKTLEETGRVFNVTRERIRQIEKKSLRKLRDVDSS